MFNNPINVIPFILVVIFMGCYSSIPPNICKDDFQGSIPKGTEMRIERNLSQRPIHIWFEKQDSIGNWIHHGIERFYFMAGDLKSETLWKEGQKDGPFKNFWDNGALRSRGNWRNNKLHGPTEEWNSKGIQISSKVWNDGKLEGWSERRDETGKLIEKSYWLKGKKLTSPLQ